MHKAGRRKPMGDQLIIQADHTEKLCAVLQCVWCGYSGPEYFAICARCKLCQYCGFLMPYGIGCIHCGNILPEDMAKKLEPKVKRLG